MNTAAQIAAATVPAGPGVTIRRLSVDDVHAVTGFLDRHRREDRQSPLAPDGPDPSIEIPTGGDERGGTLVAEWQDPISSRPTIVAIVSWRARDQHRPRQADIALIMAAGWGARGVGSALVTAAARQARLQRIVAFLVPVIPRNGALRAAADEAGFAVRRRTTRTRDEVEILLDTGADVVMEGA
jgi:hypothetical protein